MPLSQGQNLNNRYRIVKLLGQGGFGAVYRAWDTNLNRPCAVKENLDASPEAQSQFGREATILANLNHPNLARVTDYFFLAGQGQYLVMDFVEGDDLQVLLDRTGEPLPELQATGWISQICDALAYLHSQNPPIIHRDIKPANIKITPEGKAMLVDFGIAKVYNAHLRTTVGARAVTPGYSPPEQYGQGKTDPGSDLYALGATLYTLLTRITPPDSVDLMTGNVPQVSPVRLINPRVSKGVSGAVERAMQLNRTARFTGAREFKEALLSAPASPPREPVIAIRPSINPNPTMAAPAIAAPVARPTPFSASVPRRIPWIWISGASGLFVVVLLITLFSGGKQTKATPAPTEKMVVVAPTQADKKEVVVVIPPTAASANTPEPAFKSADPATFVYATFGEPETLDPALDYETTGISILMNIYDTLVFFNRENPNEYIPQLATSWTISSDGKTYTFQIRKGVKFHNGDELTAEDVAYTFQRGILQGGSASPQWLLTEPLLGSGIMDVTALVDSQYYDDPVKIKTAPQSKLESACQRVISTIKADSSRGTVTLRLAQPWAPFLGTLAQSWGGIQSKSWVVSKGGWDGSCQTWQNYYGKTSTDLNKTDLGTSAMGSGPYILDHWTPGAEIVLNANPNYWRKEPAWPNGPVGAPAIKTVVIKNIEDFSTRLAMLQAGDADSIGGLLTTDYAQLDELVGEICDPAGNCQPAWKPDQNLRLVKGLPNANHTDLFFTWSINTQDGNSFIGSGKLDGNGIPPDFFSDANVRRAFAFCFNYPDYLNQALQGDGKRTITVMLPGMAGYDENFPHYEYDPARCAEEFKASQLKGNSGKSLWDTGFRLTFAYNTGNTARQTAAQILQRELAQVNSKFQLEATGLPWSDYLPNYRAMKIPLFTSGWLEDIHDTHNWVVPYGIGMYANRQGLPDWLIQQFSEIINRGVSETNLELRSQIYREFNQVYYDKAVAILLYQTLGRHYEQRWVNGWYFNPIYPGNYYYSLSKN